MYVICVRSIHSQTLQPLTISAPVPLSLGWGYRKLTSQITIGYIMSDAKCTHFPGVVEINKKQHIVQRNRKVR